jgi:hypothetical protein
MEGAAARPDCTPATLSGPLRTRNCERSFLAESYSRAPPFLHTFRISFSRVNLPLGTGGTTRAIPPPAAADGF